MIIGAHTLIFSSNPEADLSFFRDALEFPHVDAGGGFLIFGLPSSEVAVHEAENGGSHELYLMTEDIDAFVSSMQAREVPVTPPEDQGWGIVTMVTLPGGGRLGVYQPRHPRPAVAAPQASAPRAKKRRAAKKAPKKTASKAKPAKKKAAKKKRR